MDNYHLEFDGVHAKHLHHSPEAFKAFSQHIAAARAGRTVGEKVPGTVSAGDTSKTPLSPSPSTTLRHMKFRHYVGL